MGGRGLATVREGHKERRKQGGWRPNGQGLGEGGRMQLKCRGAVGEGRHTAETLEEAELLPVPDADPEHVPVQWDQKGGGGWGIRMSTRGTKDGWWCMNPPISIRGCVGPKQILWRGTANAFGGVLEFGGISNAFADR